MYYTRKMEDYRLSNEVIGHLVQLIQLAFVTGTDISDNFTMLRMESSPLNPSELILATLYKDQADENINKLVEEAAAHRAQQEKNETKPEVM